MELKNYQRAVIRDLERYLEILMQTGSIETAYRRLWEEKHVPVGPGGMPRYQDLLPGVANVCLKVPTGGGKTFLAANAIEPIFHALGVMQQRVVVWLVPSDAILTQTLSALRNPAHPYRQKIDVAFNSRVEIYTKDQLLSATRFNISAITEQLSILVLSYDSFRGKKEQLKARQENSSLAQLAQALGTPTHPVEDADPTALLQIINQLRPVVIVDESHHARSTLSKQMLRDFNPRFVLDLTATPTKESNLISIVDAIHLRQENMVKLPVFVMNRNSQLDVLNNAVQMQSILEAQAMAEYRNGGCYIRPIVLFQAQPKGKEDAATFEKIRTILVKNGIPAEQIAIKTADINELKNADLLSPNCPIRFIITVNALKEGWDCPFAYILASLANRTSQVDVEQIVGRILRLPYTQKHPVPALNMSYVLTSSADFKHTLDGIVKGLNNAGFTDQDYRAQEEVPAPAPLPVAQQTTFSITPPAPAEEPQDIFDDPDTVRLDPVCVNSTTEPQKIAPAVQNILAQAGKEIVAFEAALQQHKDDPASDLPQEAQKMVGQTKVKAEFADEIEQLVLPKFCLKIPQSILMPSNTQELTKENLLSNFTLKGKPSNIDFDHLDNNLAQVDLDGDGTPRASKMESQYQQFIGQQFPLMPGENRLKLCRNIIHTTLSRRKKLNAVDDTELQRYVDYIIDGMNQGQLDALEQMPVNFANKICDYIIKLQEETARENFYNWLEVGKIVTQPRFKLTPLITLSGKASSLTKSLYKQECELDDNFEYDMAMALTGIDSVRWWHRNPTSGRNAFCLNAFRNHYPDFIVMTNSGKVLLVETKGDQLENAESREKIKLGRAWQNAAGSQYRYYMVFQNKDLHLEGAYRFDEFLKILGDL